MMKMTRGPPIDVTFRKGENWKEGALTGQITSERRR